MVLDLVGFRRLRKRRASEFAGLASSLGASLILLSLAQQLSHTNLLRFPFGTFPVAILQFASLRPTLLQLTIVAAVELLFGGLIFYLYRTSFGHKVRAVAVSERTAALLGSTRAACICRSSSSPAQGKDFVDAGEQRRPESRPRT
jgi:branched-chain amino acid transport system permease protein